MKRGQKLKAIYGDGRKVQKGEKLELISFETGDKVKVRRASGEEVVIAVQAVAVMPE